MDSGLSADVDRALDGLGEVPSGLSGLVERYAGRARLTPGEADALFASFARLDQVASARAGEAAQVRPSPSLDQVEPAQGPTLEAKPGELQPGAVLEPDLVGHVEPEASSQAQVAAPVMEPVGALEAKDGPLTRRMDARDVRTTPVPRRAAFAAGLFGADDLPEFPLVRPPNSVKGLEPEAAIEASSSASQSVDQTDSFEILVDEELLEIEPDDAEFEPADDE